MNKKIILILTGTALLLVGGVAGYMIGKNNTKTDVSSTINPNTTSDEPAIIDEGGLVTFEGTIGCLKPANDSEMQTLACAIGLIKENGTQYALYSDDPTVIGSVPSGQQIEVTGALQEKTSETYKEAGTIKVSSIRQL